MEKRKMGLSTKIFIGLILGLATGLLMYFLKEKLADGSFVTTIIDSFFIGFLFELVGGIFINAIRMMIIPLVFVSLTLGQLLLETLKN